MEHIKFKSLYTQVEESVLQPAKPMGELILRADITELEAQLCAYIGAPHCVGVLNATSGLIMALRAAGVGQGDLVLCTSFGFFAVRQVVELLGGRAILVDLNPNSWTVDPYCLEYVIGRLKREKQPLPKALVAVDLFGLPCDYTALEEICGRFNIALIEDMSQAMGGNCKGVKAGNFGRFAVTSFFPGRTLGESGGGAVFCRTPEDARQLALMRGEEKAGETFIKQSVAATLVTESLKRFDEECARRQAVAARYDKNLKGIVRLQKIGEGYQSARNQYAVLLRDKNTRDYVFEGLSQMEIPCRIYAPEQALQGALERAVLQNAQSIADRILTLPMHPHLTGNLVEYVSASVAELVWKREEAEK